MKLYSDPNVEHHLQLAKDKFDNDKEKILGITLNQPNEPLNSSPRKLMFSVQSTHRLDLSNPEVPLISTGYENKFGKQSSSYLVSRCDWKVLARIERYSKCPGHHYYLIVINDAGEMDLIERISYHHSTEMYGYMYNNSFIDHLNVGDEIKKDEVIRTSTSFDEFGNHMDGVNLRCCYMALSKNTEDPVILSQSAARKLSAPKIQKVEIIINDNDIPLNLYGDNINDYKIFPDIGEEIKDGVIASIRKENKDEAFFTQSIDRLSTIMISDQSYKLQGRVLDINVYSNKQVRNPDDDLYSCYEGQIQYYIDEDRRFCQEFIDVMRQYIDNSNYKKSYELSKMYTICENKLNGVQYIKDGKVFSNIYLEIYVYSENPINTGDKLSNRYGGKGVVSAILPDDQMPAMEGDEERRAELIWNQATCVNRLNAGQLVESSLNFISKSLVDYIDMNILHAEECLELILEYIRFLSDEYANYVQDMIEFGINDEEMLCILGDFIHENEDGLYLSLKPVSECVSFNKLRELYNHYSWIYPKTFYVPIEGSNGQIRFVKSKKASIISSQYVYRMKQFAEEKHSANSLSSTNIRNENSKSRASKMYMQVHSSTPIKMGEMESNICLHLGPEIYVTNMMLYSTSPQGRRDAESLLTGDPYHIDVTLSEDAKSRSVEKVNAILKTMGLRLKFRKIRKVTKGSPFYKLAPSPFHKISSTTENPIRKIVVSNESPFKKISDKEKKDQ